MNVSPYIDAGQVLISSVLSVVGLIGWFIRKELGTINSRLDDHDSKILGLVEKVSELIGAFNARQRDRSTAPFKIHERRNEADY